MIEQQVDIFPEQLDEFREPRGDVLRPFVQPDDVVVHRGDVRARVRSAADTDDGVIDASGAASRSEI
jgi:hypothetical protein